MVQLHFDKESIRTLLQNARDDLEDEYYTVLLDLYYDLESDPRVTSIATIKTILDKAKRFLKWLQDNSIEPASIDLNVLKRYLLHLRLKQLKTSTIAFNVRMLRRLLRVLGKPELASMISYPRKTLPVLQLPDPEIIEQIIAEIRSLKYKVIIALLYETGARVSEILSLKGKHVVETNQGYYRIYIVDTKNNEPRVVYVIKYSSLLREYLNIEKPGPEDYLFPSPVYSNRPIRPRNVEKILSRMSRKYNVRLYPHILRHLRATMWIKEGIPERIVMKLLGHKSEGMMQVYVNLVNRDVEETILQYYGLKLEARETMNTRTIKCIRCGAENNEQANYCWRCGLPLNQLAAQKLDQEQQSIQQRIQELLTILQQHPEILQTLKQLLTST